MPDIQMIVTDVDGTLIDHTEHIPEDLIKTVRRCQNAGIVFALSTGRTNELAAPIIKSLGITDPCVEANGAYILQNDRCLLSHGFSLQPVRHLIERADALGLTVTISDTHVESAVSETDYVRQHQKFGNRFKKLLPLDEIDWEHGQFQKLMIMDEHDTGKLTAIRTEMEQFHNIYWITRYSNRAIELGPKDCSKASGVRELAALMGIPLENVMACGDFWNDFEMISEVGWGVAVGNALPELKAAARYAAKGQYASGVIEAVNALCFGEQIGI